MSASDPLPTFRSSASFHETAKDLKLSVSSEAKQPPVPNFFLGMFLLLACAFGVSDSKLVSLLFTFLLLALAIAVAAGAIKSSPRRNAIGFIPALSLSALWQFSQRSDMSGDLPWAWFLLSSIAVSTIVFLTLERRDPRRAANELEAQLEVPDGGMSLRNYLFACYGLFLAGWVANTLMWKGIQPDLPLTGMLIIGVPSVAFGVLIWIYPFAQRVPVEERTDFWAYRTSNKVLAFFGGLLALNAVFTIYTLLRGV